MQLAVGLPELPLRLASRAHLGHVGAADVNFFEEAELAVENVEIWPMQITGVAAAGALSAAIELRLEGAVAEDHSRFNLR